MAWELKKVEDQRQELIETFISGTVSMTELCKRYGISRKTAYKWYNRYLALGVEGFKDQSREPYHPNCTFSPTIINMAIDLKLKHMHWGPRKIIHVLTREYPKIQWPSATRLYEIFKENQLIVPRRIRKRVSGTHSLGELNNSNDVWMADFKGWFMTQDGHKCEPLTITDGFSRYLIKCSHLQKKTVNDVWAVFKEAFDEYGLPKRVRTDNGPPFGSIGVGRLTRLSINLIKAGVVPEWINPGHPEENGRHERFHLTLKQAVANPPAMTIQEQIIRMATFQEEYNFERPHESLDMQTPSDCYSSSKRKWDGILRDPEYDLTSMLVRKVGQNGCVWLKQKPYYLGETLAGEYVGLKEENEELNIFYGSVYLGKLKLGEQLERPKMKPKNIVRRG
ncbi:MAG TPA: integrase core domain-containing protein [Parachlamydiaceae bacterium]|nr:transposase [Nitrosopumilus sp.]HEV8053021.1 integrase core domain-containing protein [Parachlamydiaceae bacterium]